MYKFHSILYDSITQKVSDYFYFTDEIKTNALYQNLSENYISIHVRLGDKFLETDKANVLVKNDVRHFHEDILFDFIEKKIG